MLSPRAAQLPPPPAAWGEDGKGGIEETWGEMKAMPRVEEKPSERRTPLGARRRQAAVQPFPGARRAWCFVGKTNAIALNVPPPPSLPFFTAGHIPAACPRWEQQGRKRCPHLGCHQCYSRPKPSARLLGRKLTPSKPEAGCRSSGL